MDLFAYGFARRLQERVGPALRLTFTNNRRSLVSVRRRDGIFDVRVARFFLEADNETIDGLVAFILGDVSSLPRAAQQFAESRPLARKGKKRHVDGHDGRVYGTTCLG